MGADTTTTHPGDQTSASLNSLRQEVASLRHQGAIMLHLLTTMLSALKDIRNHEDILEHDIDTVEKEIEQILGHDSAVAHCPSCGGPLDHHRASGGDLRICPACGLSQFVDAAGVVRHTALPSPLPPTEPAQPPSWVG